MEKANPVEMRKTLMLVDEFARAGIMFVPVPVLGEADKHNLVGVVENRLDLLGKEAK